MEFFLLILEQTPHSSDYERRFLVILLPSAVFNRVKTSQSHSTLRSH